jgi:malate dehydrogenase
VGSSAAFRLATLDIASEIVLIDARPNLAMSHVMDLEQAVAEISDSRIVGGVWAGLAGCDVVVLSAGLPERNVASRDEYLAGNLEIVRNAAEHLTARPEAVVIVATNPVDVFTYVLAELAGGAPSRFVGYSYNDTLRFRWALARTLRVAMADVDALVLGEHGDMQVPLFDLVSVKGVPVGLTEQQRREVEAATRTWFSTYQGLNAGRTSGWTSAMGIARLVAALAGGTNSANIAAAAGDPAPDGGAGLAATLGGVLPCSAVLQGEYGLSDVSLGVPVVLGSGGVRQIVEVPLTPLERGRLHAAAKKVRGQIDRAMSLLGGEEAV